MDTHFPVPFAEVSEIFPELKDLNFLLQNSFDSFSLAPQQGSIAIIFNT